MKVVCINNGIISKSAVDSLTEDKIYDVINSEDCLYHFWIVDDFGARYEFFKERFITLEEHRERKLLELGI